MMPLAVARYEERAWCQFAIDGHFSRLVRSVVAIMHFRSGGFCGAARGEKVMIRTFGVAALNRGDMLLRCVESVDRPVETLFVINNGEDPGVAETVGRIRNRDIRSAAMFSRIHVEGHDRLGCGPAWNRIIKSTDGPWLISSNDIQLLPGSVDAMNRALEECPDASIVCPVNYTVFALTPLGVRKAGLFDENFYPAYYEDWDHHRRVVLAEGRIVKAVDGFGTVHGEAPFWGSTTIKSDPSLNARNGITFGNLQDYYIRKWGGLPPNEIHSTPFGRELPLDWWEIEPDLRKKNAIW
jgi:hypothetical protein